MGITSVLLFLNVLLLCTYAVFHESTLKHCIKLKLAHFLNNTQCHLHKSYSQLIWINKLTALSNNTVFQGVFIFHTLIFMFLHLDSFYTVRKLLPFLLQIISPKLPSGGSVDPIQSKHCGAGPLGQKIL